jgi:hypothetical protein
MEIAACLLLEIDPEHLAVELATCDGLRDDRTKARNELHLDIVHLQHNISPPHIGFPSGNGQLGNYSWCFQEASQIS